MGDKLSSELHADMRGFGVKTETAPSLYEFCTMGHLFIRAILRGGDRVIFIKDEKEVTYLQFGDLVSQMIQALKGRGLQNGDAIGVLAGNLIEAFATTVSAQIMGLRVTSLHPLASAQDQSYILKDAEIDVLAFDPKNMSARARLLERQVLETAFLSLGPSDFAPDLLEEASGYRPTKLRAEAAGEDIAGLSYTGGTSGEPKGVIHSHRARVTMVMTELSEWEWPHDVCFLAATPISHAAGAIIPAVMMKSGRIVLANGFDAASFFELSAKHRVTSTFLVPTMIYSLLDDSGLSHADLSSLEVVIYGAAAMSPPRMLEAMEKIGPVFMQLYGQTEAPNCISALRRQDHVSNRLTSCGAPIGSNLVQLMNDEDEEVSTGEVGEICVRGPLLMNGYWNKPKETQEALRGGWLRTGDLARCDDDGFFYIVDRSKDMIITGGFNVYPREVEDTLMEHVAVANAAVFGAPDSKWGEAVRAVIVLKPGCTANEEELRRHVRKAKGPVQTPKAIYFADSIPVTGLGKPDKKEIRRLYN